MQILATLTVATAMTLAGIASAEPCPVGTTTNGTGRKGSGEASAKVPPGAKAESPGTVGAMNNVGSNATLAANEAGPPEAGPPEGRVARPGDDDGRSARSSDRNGTETSDE